MGHIRLGEIPKSRKWDAILEMVVSQAGDELPASVPDVAAQTLEASASALTDEKSNRAISYAMYVLIQLAIGATKGDLEQRLGPLGRKAATASNVMDLTVAFHEALDSYADATESRTDLFEIAQRAAGEALVRTTAETTSVLFRSEEGDFAELLRSAGTKHGFGALSQRFFARLLHGHLNFYLSRLTPETVRVGNAKIANLTEFQRRMEQHCTESSVIVRDFSADWYSKAVYENRTDHSSVQGFVAHAMDKLGAELQRQRGSR